jgi:hypothetical protein
MEDMADCHHLFNSMHCIFSLETGLRALRSVVVGIADKIIVNELHDSVAHDTIATMRVHLLTTGHSSGCISLTLISDHNTVIVVISSFAFSGAIIANGF